ncbi:MAG: DUF721 domain-containing protein [Candidatus Dactylopiibacterium sp.]|nr:DUF721 domain-containing protein [Candidatus Dactylopiibacterium sp.]
MKTRPLNTIFGRSDLLARLQAHATHLVRLQRKLDAALPAASHGAASVANFKEGELTIHVVSPVMATRLRLSLESLKTRLQVAGEPVTSIKVKVRASPFQGNFRTEEAPVRPIGRDGRAALETLADSLAPEDPLARALRHMVSRCARR